MTKFKLITTIVFVLISIGGIFYYIMHNTISTSIIIASDRIITNDGLGPYEPDVDGVSIGYGFNADIYLMDLNQSSRLVYVNFAQALWKDANLRDMPSMLQSKNYRMVLFILVQSDHTLLDIFKMGVGDRFVPPKLHVDIAFYDPNTGMLSCLNTILEEGPYGFFDISINLKTPEPPRSLRDDGYVTFTRTTEETWVLDANTWFVSYYRSSSGNILKDYVKLSLNMTINNKRGLI